MGDDSVSFQTAREYYRVWRWRLELEPAQQLESNVVQIAASSLEENAKVRLSDVAWAVASFERRYHMLLEDILHAETSKRDGVPAIMGLIGRYSDSLERMLYTSLWMELGDVFVAYRTIANRLAACKRYVLSEADILREVRILRGRRLLDLSARSVTDLADDILHTSWDPSGERSLAVQIFWKGPEHVTLDFAEGDFRSALLELVDETLEQVNGFIHKACLQTAGTSQPRIDLR